MKPLFYITIEGRYIKENEMLSKRKISFSIKDTNTDFHVGGIIFHKRRLVKIEKITYERI